MQGNHSEHDHLKSTAKKQVDLFLDYLSNEVLLENWIHIFNMQICM